MHIVTKILIVFAAVLSILLAALTITLAANSDAVASSFKAEQTAKLQALSQLQNVLTEKAASDSRHAQEIEPIRRRAEDNEAKVSQLQTERASLINAKKEAEAAVEILKNQSASSVVTIQTQAALGKSLKDELDAARKAQLDSARQLAEVIERLNESERLRQVLEQTTRSLREQLEETKLTAEQNKSGATAANADKGFELSGPRLSGRITKVFKSPAGDELVAINLGSAAGLKVGVKMNIVRDGYLASVVLVSVDLNESVGKVDKLGRTVEVRTEDLVLSTLN